MKVLLIDPAGAFVDFALRCIAHGHEVKQWIRKPPGGEDSKIGQGLIPRVYNWQAHMKWADIVVLSDNAYQMRELEKYHKEGYPIFGASDLTADLELNRGFGQRILEKAGMDVIPSMTFNDYNSAIDYVKNNPKRYVSKPSGDADKALSYVSKSPADMIFMLERWKSKGKLKQPFLLQEFVPGIEVAVGTWVGKNGFTDHICENFEFKKLMSGNYGVNTGEMGTVLKYVKESTLFDETLAKVEDFLVYHNYTGYVDLAFIVDSKGSPRPLEWTTRPGWPLFNIQAALHKGDPVDWMLNLFDGFDTLKTSNKTAVGVLAAIPDFPFTKSTGRDPSGYPIYGLEKLKSDDYHLCEVMSGTAPVFKDGQIKKENMIVSAGDYVLVTTGIGDDICTAAKKAYEVMDKIEIPNSLIVRDDIGERLEKELPILQSYDYCTDFVYEAEEEEDD
jgi:phosphoribosylamine---glycine ligase